MTIYDLINIIYENNKEHCVDDDSSTHTTIEDINNLIWEIEKDPKSFTEALSKEITEFASRYNRCPLCGEELSPTVWYEDRPYGDTYAKEKMVEYTCKNSECGGR